MSGYADIDTLARVLSENRLYPYDPRTDRADAALSRVRELAEAAERFERYAETAEMRWMSLEDASVDVLAREVAELTRALRAVREGTGDDG